MPYYPPPTAPGGGITNIKVSAGTLSALRSDVSFNNSNGISFGLETNGIITGTVQTNYITTAMASNRGSDFVQATAAFAGTSASGTIASGGISVSIGPYITTGALSNHSHGVSFTSGSVGFQTLSFTNSNGISFNSGTQGIFGSHNAITTGALSNHSHGVSFTSGSVGFQTLSFTNSNGISFNSGTQGIFGSHNAITTGALSDHSHGNPQLNLTNLSGTTASNSAGFTLSLSAAAPGAGGAVSFSAGTSSAALGSIVFSNSNNISFGLNGSTMTGSVAAPGGGAGATLSEWCPYPEMPVLTASALVNNSLYFSPIDLREALNAYRINFFLSVATLISASNNTKSAGWTMSLCLYSRGTDTNSTRLESMLSRSAYMRLSASSNSNVSYTHPIGISNSTAVSSVAFGSNATNASTYGVNSIGGYRVLPFPVSSTLTPGRYWIAVAVSSVSANAQGLLAATVAQQTHGSNIAYMPFGTSSKASNASWPQAFAGRGVYSITSGAFPASVNMITDHIRALATTVVLPFFNVSGLTTATDQL